MLAAANPNRDLLRFKTEQCLQELAGRTGGALGLAALDLVTGERFGVHDQLCFPQASAIKIPVLLEVFRQAATGRWQLTESCRIHESAKTAGTGILCELGAGTVTMNWHDLCVLMILISDNTATNLLIDHCGMENINQTMADLGLTQTRIRRRMMDAEASARGEENLSTPTEAIRLLEILHRGEFVNPSVSADILDLLRKPKASSIAAGLPPGTPIAGKPGAIGGVTVEWAIVSAPDRPFALAIMENFGVGREGGDAIREISRVLYDYFQRLGRASPHGSYRLP